MNGNENRKRGIDEDGENDPADGSDSEDIKFLLQEIEQEPIPERLLALAEELQRALTKHKAEFVKKGPSGADE